MTLLTQSAGEKLPRIGDRERAAAPERLAELGADRSPKWRARPSTASRDSRDETLVTGRRRPPRRVSPARARMELVLVGVERRASSPPRLAVTSTTKLGSNESCCM